MLNPRERFVPRLPDDQIRETLSEYSDSPQDPEVAEIFAEEIRRPRGQRGTKPDLDQTERNYGDTVSTHEKISDRQENGL